MISFTSYVTRTVSLPELIWTIVTGIGLYLNFSLTRSVFKDLNDLREAKINHLREFAAVSSVLSESLKLFIQFCFFSVGVVAMCIPAQSRTNVPTFQWVLTMMFIICAAAITGTAILEKIRRKRLIELILEYES